jgi:hypothetical protein
MQIGFDREVTDENMQFELVFHLGMPMITRSIIIIPRNDARKED